MIISRFFKNKFLKYFILFITLIKWLFIFLVLRYHSFCADFSYLILKNFSFKFKTSVIFFVLKWEAILTFSAIFLFFFSFFWTLHKIKMTFSFYSYFLFFCFFVGFYYHPYFSPLTPYKF